MEINAWPHLEHLRAAADQLERAHRLRLGHPRTRARLPDELLPVIRRLDLDLPVISQLITSLTPSARCSVRPRWALADRIRNAEATEHNGQLRDRLPRDLPDLLRRVRKLAARIDQIEAKLAETKRTHATGRQQPGDHSCAASSGRNG